MRRIYCYPVDVHASRPVGTDFKQFERDFNTLRYGPGESYGIPYRCLTPRGVSNLLVAGRCISADRRMQGSVRVMPACFITGQAAGMAAALAQEHHTETRGVDVRPDASGPARGRRRVPAERIRRRRASDSPCTFVTASGRAAGCRWR